MFQNAVSQFFPSFQKSTLNPTLCVSLGLRGSPFWLLPSLAFFAFSLTVISLQDYLSTWLPLLNYSLLFFYSSSSSCIILTGYLCTQFYQAFSHYVISSYKAFWNTVLYMRHTVWSKLNWIFFLKVRGLQHLSSAKSAEFSAPNTNMQWLLFAAHALRGKMGL